MRKSDNMKFKRIFLMILDSIGVGEALDANNYDDNGANTLGHIKENYDLFVPNLKKLGFLNTVNMDENKDVDAYYTIARPTNPGKDTLNGHYEIMGVKNDIQFKTFTEKGFPRELLDNIELSKGDHKTEIDFIVITQKAIYILEVKNTQKDVKIDEAGNLIKVGYSEVFEKPLAENMNEKEYLVRSILEEAGYKNLKIISLVVFANSRINVENNYKHLEHCFLGSLPKIIDGNEDDYLYTIKNISKMAKEISFAEQKEKYVPSFDVESYKVAYAKLIAKIEDAALEQENENIIEEPKIPFYKTKIFKKIGRVAMCIAGVLSIKTAVKMAKN